MLGYDELDRLERIMHGTRRAEFIHAVMNQFRNAEESNMPNGDASIDAGQQGQTVATPTITNNTVYFGISAGGAYGYYYDAQGTMPLAIDDIPVGVQLSSVIPHIPNVPHPVPVQEVTLPDDGEHAELVSIEDYEHNNEDEDKPMPQTDTVANPYEMVYNEGDSTMRQKKIETIAFGILSAMKEKHKDSRWYQMEMENIKRSREDLMHRESDLKRRQLEQILQSKKITAIKKGMVSVAQEARWAVEEYGYQKVWFDGRRLQFEMRGPTYIRYEYSQGVSQNYRIGMFNGYIDFGARQLRFYNSDTSMSTWPEGMVDYAHPHISGSHPCLGHHEPEVKEWIDSINLKQLLSFIPRYLSSYNKESPYQQISRWEFSIPEKQRICTICYRYKTKWNSSLGTKQLCKCELCKHCSQLLTKCANLCTLPWIPRSINQLFAQISRQFTDEELRMLKAAWDGLTEEGVDAYNRLGSQGKVKWIEHVVTH